MESNSIPGKKEGLAVAASADALVGVTDIGSVSAPFLFDRKGYDPLHRAFHRVKPHNYDVQTDSNPASADTITLTPPSGKGYDCGCRSPDDFTTSSLFDSIIDGVVEGLETAALSGVPGAKQALDKLDEQFGKDADKKTVKERIKKFLANLLEGLFFRSFLVHIPSWVPVNRENYGPTFVDAANAHNVTETTGADGKKTQKEAEVEVEGFLTRSYLTRHHRPYTQWSRFYHWSFQVAPTRGFKHLIGSGNDATPAEIKLLNNGDNPRESANELYLGRAGGVVPLSSLECLFDVGAFSFPPRDRKALTQSFDPTESPSVHYDKRWPFWPQSGDYFWAAGRFVYDCTHATTENKTGDKIGLHPTLINPVKAFAVSRYEAFKFDELDEFVPVTRFMFLATSRGGYQDFDDKSDIKFKDTDYEFILDLPPLDDDSGEFAIGRTPQFNHNTIVARPRLLQNIAFAPYGTGADSPMVFEQLTPDIQLVRPEAGKLPRQVRVKIPLSKLATRTTAYGFVLSLGWHDERQTAKVKKVVVKIPQLDLARRTNDLRFNMCVNGRWIYFPTTKPVGRKFINPNDGKQNFPDANGLVLHIPDDGKVTVTAQGTQRNNLGQFMEETPSVTQKGTDDRELFVGGLLQISDEQAKFIRDQIEKGLGNQIPSGVFKEVDAVKKVLSDENIKKILKSAVDDLTGTRRIVNWKRDVDSIEADKTKAHQLASAIAREMKVFPIFNSDNQPMGLAERNLPRVGADTVVQMKNLADRQKANQPALAINYQALQTLQPDETGFMMMNTKAGEDGDYVLHCTMIATDPDVPAK